MKIQKLELQIIRKRLDPNLKRLTSIRKKIIQRRNSKNKSQIQRLKKMKLRNNQLQIKMSIKITNTINTTKTTNINKILANIIKRILSIIIKKEISMTKEINIPKATSNIKNSKSLKKNNSNMRILNMEINIKNMIIKNSINRTIIIITIKNLATKTITKRVMGSKNNKDTVDIEKMIIVYMFIEDTDFFYNIIIYKYLLFYFKYLMNCLFISSHLSLSWQCP